MEVVVAGLEDSIIWGWLDDSSSDEGKIKTGWDEPKLALFVDGGEGDVIVPVDTIVGRWGISIGPVGSCAAIDSDESVGSFEIFLG